MGVHTKFMEGGAGDEPTLVVIEAQEAQEAQEEEEDVNVCPTFTNEEDEGKDLPRRNLDAAFASTPTLPKKRRMPMIVDSNAAGTARQLPVARAGLGGASSDELSLERMQVGGDQSNSSFFLALFSVSKK